MLTSRMTRPALALLCALLAVGACAGVAGAKRIMVGTAGKDTLSDEDVDKLFVAKK